VWPFRKPAPASLSIDDVRQAVDNAVGEAVERALVTSILDVQKAPQGWPYALDQPHQFWMTTSPRRLPGKTWTVDSLRLWARSWDPLRSVIEYLKAEAASTPIAFAARDGLDASTPQVKRQIEIMKAYVADDGPLGGAETRRTFEAKLFEDLLVIGAYAVWYERTRAGGMLSCHVLDAGTIKRRVDEKGWPDHEIPYEQWVIGVQVAQFRPGEIRYDGMHPRTDTPYFDSPVEFAVSRILAGLSLDEHNTAWVTSPNVRTGDVIALPESWTPEQVQQFTAFWEAGAERLATRFLPSGSSKLADHSRSDQDFQEFEIQVIRRLCAVYGVQPASVGYVGEQYKVSQGDAMRASQRVGLGRILAVRKEFYDDLARRLGCPDVEARDVLDDLEQRSKEASISVQECGGPYKTVNEVRAERGLAPVEGGDELHGQKREERPAEPEDDATEGGPGSRTPAAEEDPSMGSVERSGGGEDGEILYWFRDARSGKAVPVHERQAIARLAMRAAEAHNGPPPIEGADPGSTHDIRGRNLVGTDAYAVATHEDLGEVLPGQTVREEDVARFIRRHLDLLKQGMAVGTWYSKERDVVCLDIVTLVRDRAEAIALGVQHNQEGIVHLETLEYIMTGGTGEVR
jgi:hypothetical protein